MTIMLTVSIWHNVTRDPAGRPSGFAGFTPGDQMVKVFTYDTPAGGRSPEAAVLARQYRQRRLRSLSFPGNWPCCSRWCCLHRRAVWPRSSSRPLGERTSCERQPGTRRPHR